FLGYTTDDDDDAGWVHLEPPDGLPVLNLQRVPEAKGIKNRLHLDVFVDDPEDWIGRAEDLGAHVVRRHDSDADWFCVLTDPAGNEFCICLEATD
ncbi:MAG: VOC family protein, partial [Ilumatobacteraceae bacterium]